MGKARARFAGWAIGSSIACLAGAAAAGGETGAPADAFYAALHGEPEPPDAALLAAAPGRFVGHAVRTRGRLRTVDANALLFDLTLGTKRARLHLEPEARAVLVARAAAWDGEAVEVDGLFYRDADGPAGSGYALRVWRVRTAEREDFLHNAGRDWLEWATRNGRSSPRGSAPQRQSERM